jgi:hypothetical protein
VKTAGKLLLGILVAAFALGAYVGSRAGAAFGERMAERRKRMNGNGAA